jgi:uncharacterized protein YaaR (DUF327 family)
VSGVEIRVSETTPVAGAQSADQKERVSREDFEFALSRVGKEGLTERLSKLIGDITEAGRRIARHTDIKEMKQYRGLIKEFINEVVTNSHEFSRENFLDRRGRHRVYGIVKLVDKNLDELAQELMAQEKDHIAILNKTDEIRGLLLDMIV